MQIKRDAKYQIGDIVRHRMFAFRGVIFDVDAEMANSEDWYGSIPEEVRPHRDQPYYHLFAENEKNHYVAYVSEQNLIPDTPERPVKHPDIPTMFSGIKNGRYIMKPGQTN